MKHPGLGWKLYKLDSPVLVTRTAVNSVNSAHARVLRCNLSVCVDVCLLFDVWACVCTGWCVARRGYWLVCRNGVCLG